MGRVLRGAGLACGLLLTAASPGDAAQTVAPSIPLPSAGNVTVARFAIKASTPRSATPKLTVAGRGALPADAYAVATVSKTRVPSVVNVTVAVVRPGVTPSSDQAPPRGQPLTLRLPAGYSLAAPPRVAQDVLYTNQAPKFGFVPGGTGALLTGTNPAKLPLEQIVKDAQLLALDRSVPLADAALLGLPFVAVQFAGSRTTTTQVTFVLSRLPQVNAVEVRFPAGVKVTSVVAPEGVEGMPMGNAVRIIGSGGFLDEGIAYSCKVQLSRAPRIGEFVTVRASTHYFENTLPFTERFALP
jgi:hypothetical protein